MNKQNVSQNANKFNYKWTLKDTVFTKDLITEERFEIVYEEGSVVPSKDRKG